MSGNYNINLFKQINENVKKDDKIILFGKKGINFIKGKDIDENILFSSSISEKDFNFLWFTNLSKKVFFEYNKNNIGKISIIYTRIMPNKKIISTAEDIFPLKVGKEIDINYNFEQNIEKIYKKAIIFFIHSMFYTAFIESKFCEQIARKNAMNDANENISKTIDELKNQYNKKRQEKITNSIFKNIENE
jgi:F-type H+-transporting ATPase subunit gamma